MRMTPRLYLNNIISLFDNKNGRPQITRRLKLYFPPLCIYLFVQCSGLADTYRLTRLHGPVGRIVQALTTSSPPHYKDKAKHYN